MPRKVAVKPKQQVTYPQANNLPTFSTSVAQQSIINEPQEITPVKKRASKRKSGKAEDTFIQESQTIIPGTLVDSYVKLQHRDQIYKVPDTYIGSIAFLKDKDFVFDMETQKLKHVIVTTPSGVQRLLLEIVSNAMDNVLKSREIGLDPIHVEVTLTSDVITVTNYGKYIPITYNEVEKMYNPQLIFGELLSSSNYNFGKEDVEVRIGCGRNGYGAKLVNIFSKWFQLRCSDGTYDYEQTWIENMTQLSEPTIIPSVTGVPYTQVSWLLDFDRFGYKSKGYDKTELELFARICVDCATAVNIPLYLNGNLIFYENFSDYAALYFTKVKSSAEFNFPFIQSGKECYIKFLLFDSTEGGKTISFANGIMTKYGGCHLEPIKKNISKKVIDIVCPEKIKGKKRPLDVNDVFRHLSMILIAKVVNPEFTGQTKGELTNTPINLKIPKFDLAPIIGKWELIERLKAEIYAKDYKNLIINQTKKKGKKDFDGLDNANYAFHKDVEKRMATRLYLTEGKSASAYGKYAASINEDSGNYVGVFAMQGKPLNCIANDLNLAKDKDKLNQLTQALGLVHDKEYNTTEAIQTLGYGGVIIVADADDDGKHIIGLIIAFFYRYFPHLLACGYIVILRTPIYRLSRHKEKISMLSDYQYELWKQETVDWKKWKHEYFKGLASNSEEQTEMDFMNPKYSQCVYDDNASQFMLMAFDKKNTAMRKQWLTDWTSTFGVEELDVLDLSDFIRYELGVYSKTNVRRSIPRLADGLKPSQRKVVYGCMKIKKWRTFFGRSKKLTRKGSKAEESSSEEEEVVKEQSDEDEEPVKINGKNKKTKGGKLNKPEKLQTKADKVKLDSLVAAIAESTHYHHGHPILVKTTVWMAQGFVGSNNLSYFVRESLMGSRDAGGKDCGGARYCSTSPEWWLNYVFKKEDDALLEYEIEDGEKAEPRFMLPIVPLQVINGSNGIGTGWSTFIPCHHPVDVINNLIIRMQTGKFEKIYPWYKGFKGKILLTSKKVKRKECISTLDSNLELDKEGQSDKEGQLDKEETPQIIEQEESFKFSDKSFINMGRDIYTDADIPTSMITIGEYTSNGKSITITELPIGTWTDDYLNYLKKLKQEGIIRDYDRFKNKANMKIIIRNKDLPVTSKGLGLETAYGLTNMVCLDINDKPVRYDTIIDMLEDFYIIRLSYYHKRKAMMIKLFEDNLERLSVLLKFLIAVNDRTLLIKDRLKSEVLADMKEMGFPGILFSTKTYKLAKDEIKKVEAEIVAARAQLEEFSLRQPEDLWYEDLFIFRDALLKRGYDQ